jgi:diguanylate cyclase (GGDEF)-like protein/PAS domain S-box-containing protein
VRPSDPEGRTGCTGPRRVLIVEDRADDAELVVRALRSDGLEVVAEVVRDEAGYREALKAEPEVIISDFHLPGFDGRRALELARAQDPGTPFILVSGVLREEDALELFQYGATDYLLKDRLARLGTAVRQALEQRDLERRERDAIEALRRSERRFRSLVQNGSGVICTTDADGVIAYMSPSVERLTGFPPEHYSGTNINDHSVPEDGAQDAFARSVAVPGSVMTDRARMYRWDGAARWAECTRTNLLHDPDVGAVIFNLVDISDREQALAAVTASEDRYRRIVEGTQEAILVLDLDGAVAFASAQADQLFGVAPGGLLTQSIDELIEVPETRRAFLGSGASAARVEVPLGRGADVRWVSVASDPLYGADGTLGGHLVLASDVTERRLAEAEVRLQARLLESVGESVFALDTEGRVLYYNPATQAMFGRKFTGATGEYVVDLTPMPFREAADRLFARMRADRSWSGELTMVRGDGSMFPALLTASPALGEQGEEIGILFVVVDLSLQRAAADELEARARQQSAVAALGNRALAEHDPASFFDALLAAATHELGVDRASLFQLDPRGEQLVLRATSGLPVDLVDQLEVPADPARLMGFALQHHSAVTVDDFVEEKRFVAVQEIMEHGVRSAIAVVVGGVEQPFGVLAVGSTQVRVFTQQEVDFVTGLANVLAAAVARHRAEAELAWLVHHDALTGLANRSSFEAQMRQAFTDGRGSQMALLLFDVRALQLVNDAMGHTVGDQVLVGVAQRLVAAVADPVVVARLGSDGFAVVVDGVQSADDAIALARSLRALLAPPHTIDGAEVSAPVNVGVALPAADGPTDPAMRLRVLLRQADLALHRAKLQGGGGVELFDDAMRDDATARLEMATSLRGAVGRGELYLRYQPEVPLHATEPVWAEVLLRWEHPELGPVGPDEFIPVAEESGSIIEIGAWVLRMACRQLLTWREEGAAAPAVLAVNLSPRQLAHPGLVDTVATILREEGVEPSELALEITETAVMADPVRSLATVTQLRELGVLLAIDDFGTGYSSLALLQEFPVVLLKIDRSFISGLADSRSDRSIVAAVVGLARALRLVTVAEGVETAEQLALLTEMGCDAGQGYLWSKPLAPDDLIAWIASRRQSAG